MSEVSIHHAGNNLAEYLRLQFVESYPHEVGATALSHFVEAAPDTYMAKSLAPILEGLHGQA